MKTFLCLFTLCAGLFRMPAMAQYETWRYPQQASEIQKMKAAGVQYVTIYADVSGAQQPYGVRFYNSDGRIVRNIDARSHSYFWYDAEGRVQKCVDSAFDGRRFVPSTYTFTYAPDGGLQNCQAGKSVISFAYNAENMELSEVVNENTLRYYRYNEDGKLVEDISGDAEKPCRRKLTYNKYGDLASELLVRANEEGKDSIITVYSFDSKSHLVRKQMNSFHWAASEDPTMPAEETKKIEIWGYTYTMNGTLGAETKTSPTHPGENYRVEWQYDHIMQLPLKELRYNGQNKLEKTLTYKYNTGK